MLYNAEEQRINLLGMWHEETLEDSGAMHCIIKSLKMGVEGMNSSKASV